MYCVRFGGCLRLVSAAGFAQTGLGTIPGTVTDASSGAVVNARGEAARAPVPGGLTLRGCVLLRAGRFILVETATSAVSELRGMNLVENLGNRVTITGATSAVLTSFRDAVRAVNVDGVTGVSPGGCLTAAAFIGAETTAPKAAPEDFSGMNRPSFIRRVTAPFLTPGKPDSQPASKSPPLLPEKSLTVRTAPPFPGPMLGQDGIAIQSPTFKSSEGTSPVAWKPRAAPTQTAFEQTPPQKQIVDKPLRTVPSGRPGPEASVEVLQEPGSRWGQLVGKVPLLQRFRNPVQTEPPIPVYQAKPSFKLSDKQGLVRPVSVDVKVRVGESGGINDAEVVEYGDPPNFSLARAALAAARDWKFEPARDSAVTRVVILRFRFSP